MKATREEIETALADRDYWRAIGAPLGWSLRGWTYRYEASFALPDGVRSIEVHAGHIALLEAHLQHSLA